MAADLTEVLVPCFVVLGVVLAVLCLCCTNKGKEILRTVFGTSVEHRGLISSTRVVFVKEADQTGVRDVEKRILSRLKGDLARTHVQLVEKKWNSMVADEETPIIVFCVYSSRLGVDIDGALVGIRGHASIILVILHPHNIVSDLPYTLADDEYLLEDEMKNRTAGRMAHFAFSTLAGLYDCRQNDDGYQKLRECVLNSRAGKWYP